MASITDNNTSTKIQNKQVKLAGRILFFVLLALAIIAVVIRAAIVYNDIVSTMDVPRVAAFETWGMPLAGLGWYRVILRFLYAAIWMGIGAFIFSQRNDDRMGLLAAIFCVLFGAASTGLLASEIALIHHWDSLPIIIVRVVETLAWMLIMYFWGMFPNGSTRPHWIMVLATVWLIVPVLSNLPSDSPYYLHSKPALVQVAPTAIIATGIFIGQFLRYRRNYTPIQKAQVRWFLLIGAFGWALSVVIFPLIERWSQQNTNQDIFLLEFIAPLFEFWLISIPIAILVSMLRYRLWDVDIAINRSLVYGIVAGILIAMIFLLVTVAQFVFADNVNILFALVLSGIVSAALWRPLQQRVQHFVDVRIYGMRFDQNQLKAAQKPLSISTPGALSGHTLGVYQVGDLIGQGGMGEVYMAQGEGQTVAIKTIAQVMQADSNSLKRFEREAQIGISLNHPNIANVYAFDNVDGMYYMVQEYLAGEDLKAWIQNKGILELETTVAILQDLASALDMAHGEGFVHRDIKPANIMICPNEDNETYRAVLMDFGITKIKDASTELTGTGIIGTIDYMAPEQIQSRKTIDGRADIYALAVVAYEMLTGQRPFTGSLTQILFAHMSQPAPDPREFAPDLSSDTAHALMKALEKDPDARFATAADFVAALV